MVLQTDSNMSLTYMLPLQTEVLPNTHLYLVARAVALQTDCTAARNGELPNLLTKRLFADAVTPTSSASRHSQCLARSLSCAPSYSTVPFLNRSSTTQPTTCPTSSHKKLLLGIREDWASRSGNQTSLVPLAVIQNERRPPKHNRRRAHAQQQRAART